MKYTNEHSAGGIVYKRIDGIIHIALIYREYHHDWTLPKGHLEGDETPEQAALREVEEEGGLIANIITYVGHSVYTFFERRKKKHIKKRVDYYLMKLITDKGEIQLEEVDELGWFPFLEAQKKLTFKHDRDLVANAITQIPPDTIS